MRVTRDAAMKLDLLVSSGRAGEGEGGGGGGGRILYADDASRNEAAVTVVQQDRLTQLSPCLCNRDIHLAVDYMLLRSETSLSTFIIYGRARALARITRQTRAKEHGKCLFFFHRRRGRPDATRPGLKSNRELCIIDRDERMQERKSKPELRVTVV